MPLHFLRARFWYALAILLVVSVLTFGIYRVYLKATKPRLASSLEWRGVMGADRTEQKMYCLMARGFLRAPQSPDAEQQVQAWLRAHPHAVVEPVGRLETLIYSWVVNGSENLNLELARAGCFDANLLEMLPEMSPLVDKSEYDRFLRMALLAGKEAEREKRGIWKDPPPGR